MLVPEHPNPMKFQLFTSLLLATATLSWAVPSEINYQGRLTDANGDAVTGDVTMSLKMFDAATEGNEIYSEDIGTVTLDNNGIYSFEFGASGQSVIDRTDTIAVADGVATTFTGSVSSTPSNGTLSVSDGTYNWNIVDGNPGQQATATAQLVNGFVVGITVTNGGEGYTTVPVVTINGDGTAATATAVVENGALTAINADTTGSGYTNASVSIAPPPAPYVVYYSAGTGTVTVTYESAPISGTEIVANYEADDSTIVGALSGADERWLELSISGNAQSPRERILMVPYACEATYANDAIGKLRREIDRLNRDMMLSAKHFLSETSEVSGDFRFVTSGATQTSHSLDVSFRYNAWNSYSFSEPFRFRTMALSGADTDNKSMRATYTDGTVSTIIAGANPYPEKSISMIECRTGYYGWDGKGNLTFYKFDISETLHPVEIESASINTLWFFPQTRNLSSDASDKVFYYLVGNQGEILINPNSATKIPENIGDLEYYRIVIIPDLNVTANIRPVVDSFIVRYTE